MNQRQQHGRLPGVAAFLAVVTLALAAFLAAAAGPAYRVELLSLGSAFNTLRYGIYLGIAAGALGVIALGLALWRRHLRTALVSGLVVAGSLAMLVVPYQYWQRSQQAPPIHDITTDTDDPPAFEALAPAREAAPNAVEYPGEETARQQHEAYPDIEPLMVDAALPTVLQAAEAAVLDFGWELVEVGDTSIEATDVTTWFGFKDDVVIRLREEAEGVRVDVRSASRLGRGDVGTNAARIHDYLEALERRLSQARS